MTASLHVVLRLICLPPPISIISCSHQTAEALKVVTLKPLLQHYPTSHGWSRRHQATSPFHPHILHHLHTTLLLCPSLDAQILEGALQLNHQSPNPNWIACWKSTLLEKKAFHAREILYIYLWTRRHLQGKLLHMMAISKSNARERSNNISKRMSRWALWQWGLRASDSKSSWRTLENPNHSFWVLGLRILPHLAILSHKDWVPFLWYAVSFCNNDQSHWCRCLNNELIHYQKGLSARIAHIVSPELRRE